ncbi:MAG TPA: YraN family protein [Candidatus Saccharimonadales bacterium]|nr:YraN family protein [Candidatus Saccharimonadales bacterium]
MKTTEQGRLAEAAVTELLKARGYKILDQNWRTRLCEIDIVAAKGKIAYFVEVKYRASNNQGDGFEYITPRKLSQMSFASEVWVQENSWSGDYRLMAAAVTGADAEDIELVEL